MKKTSNNTKEVTRKTIETLINNKNYFRITSNDETCKTPNNPITSKNP